MYEVIPGNWYFTVTCKNADCAQPIIFGQAPSPLDSKEGVVGQTMRLKCSPCGHADVYHPEDMQIVQASYKQ